MPVLLCAQAHAQAVATTPVTPDATALAWDVESLVAEALARNPDLTNVRERHAAARRRPDQAAALPNPQLALGYTNDGWRPSLGGRDMTTLALVASQTLPAPGKRGLRVAVALAEAEQAGQAVARAERGLRADVQRAVLALQEAQALLVLVREQSELWRETESVARARYAVGQGAQQDVLRAQVELTRARQFELEQEFALEFGRAEMARLLGRGESPAGLPPPLPDIAPWSEREPAVLARLEDTSPELSAGRQALAAEQARLALAQRAGRPDVTVQAGYMHRGGLDAMWQAGLSLDWPVRRRPRAEAVAEAEARTRAARAQLESLRQNLRLRTHARLLTLHNLEQVTALYERGIVAQDRLTVEAAVASYQAGKVPFVAVLEALATLYADRAALVRMQASHARARVAVEEASLDGALEPPTGLGSAGPSARSAGAGAAMTDAPTGAPAGTAASNSGMRMP
jgi:outer membrane protein TolC